MGSPTFAVRRVAPAPLHGPSAGWRSWVVAVVSGSRSMGSSVSRTSASIVLIAVRLLGAA